MNELKIKPVSFEDIKHINELGEEYWEARELMPLLEYSKWKNFHKVIKKAMMACENSNYEVMEQFPEFRKPIIGGNGNKQNVVDYHLSRYACYLIVQNANPKKESVAVGQTYFAVQTRKQEILEEEYDKLSEDEKRLYQRNLTKKGNYSLNQTKQKLLKDNVKTEINANKTHYEVGKEVRNTIEKLGGVLPENCPTPKKSLKELSKERQKLQIKSESKIDIK